jgi:hypothetical protein
MAATLLHTYVAAFAVAMACTSLLAQPTAASCEADGLPAWLAWCSLLMASAAAMHGLYRLVHAFGLAAGSTPPIESEGKKLIASDSGLQMLTSNPIHQNVSPEKPPLRLRQELEA